MEGNKSSKSGGILSNVKTEIFIKDEALKETENNIIYIFFNFFSVIFYLTVHVPMTLVLGYMRSGSSLTADIIRCNHGDFYIFEPLHGLIELSIKQNSPVRFLNGTRIRYMFTQVEFFSFIFFKLQCNTSPQNYVN